VEVEDGIKLVDETSLVSIDGALNHPTVGDWTEGEEPGIAEVKGADFGDHLFVVNGGKPLQLPTAGSE
jgi:hypothetical protein